MRVVLAPDKFKGCLSAAEVAAAVARGLHRGRADVETVALPVADGGDGTVLAALSAGYREVRLTATGPTGRPVDTSYALLGDRAVVELATVVGLDRLPEGRLDALGASTYGLGEVIADALDRGATSLVLGVGGSASTDGGAGMVQALGARLRDAHGDELSRGGESLSDLVGIDVTPLKVRLGATAVVVASDVDNPLLGPAGAAAVFGPQKGASPADVVTLDAALTNWSRVVSGAIGRDEAQRAGAGAAGGTGYAALALLDATIRPGIGLILELLDFDAAVADANLVITGEGSLDEQSLAGKAPYGVAQAAARRSVRVVAVAGRCLLGQERLEAAGFAAAYPLSELEPDVRRSIANASDLLEQVGERIAKEWLV